MRICTPSDWPKSQNKAQETVFRLFLLIFGFRARPNEEKQKRTNRLSSVFFGKNEGGVQTQDTRDKPKLKSKTKTSQRSRWSTSTNAPSSCGRGGAQPSTNRGVCPHGQPTIFCCCKGTDPEARDLLWTKSGCCSNITITFATTDDS